MFKAGQKVVCILPDSKYWVSNITEKAHDGPVYGDVCTVTGQRGNYLFLKEWSCGGEGWKSDWFRPANPSKVHQELIEQFHLTQVPEAPELIPQTA